MERDVFIRAFGRELVRPVRLLLWALFTGGIVTAVTLTWEAEKGAIAGAVLLGFFLIFTALTAYSHGETEFFRGYAKSRGLTYVEGIVRPPFQTELFETGRARWTEQTLVGELEGGRAGLLGLFVYEVFLYRDPKSGEDTTKEFRHTIAATYVPELEGQIADLTVQPRTGFRFFDSAEDAIKSGRHRVEVESEELDSRYEIFIGDESDAGFARQIFSPSFIDWLAGQPYNIGFQLEGRELVVAVKGHHKSAEPLDELWDRTGAIAARLAEEGAESARAPAASGFDLKAITNKEHAKSDRLVKRRVWVALPMIVVAGAGFWVYMDYQSGKESPAERAAEEREVEENLQFYEEHKCEINPDLYGCPGNK